MPRPLPPVDRNALLNRLAGCREAMVELRAGSPPRSLLRAAADQMIANIDDLAWLVTGERDLFHAPGHGPSLYRGAPQGPNGPPPGRTE